MGHMRDLDVAAITSRFLNHAQRGHVFKPGVSISDAIHYKALGFKGSAKHQ